MVNGARLRALFLSGYESSNPREGISLSLRDYSSLMEKILSRLRGNYLSLRTFLFFIANEMLWTLF